MGIFMTLNQMLGRGTWPPPALGKVWDEVELYAALRASDSERLRQERSIEWQRDYIVSPLPRMISRASAHLLYGEPPDITAADERDQDNLERIIDENDLPAELHRAAVIASSEGEVWGRIVVAPDLLDVPIIEFVSRSRVIPHFAGRFLLGATFVTAWATGTIERYRLFETYEAGAVTNRLFKGTTSNLGTEVELASFDNTAGMQEMVLTGMDEPLVAFIPNTIDSDPTRGYSDYAGLTDRFFALNEASTTGQHNLRLAGHKRALVDQGYLNKKGRVPDGDDIFLRTSRHGGDDAKAGAPLAVIDYNFNASEVVAWIDHLIDTSLTYAGVAPQVVGRSVDGGAISGTALRLKAMHSLLESSGKGRYFDRGARRLLRAAQVIDGRPITQNGFGRQWAKRDELPTIERQDGLPRDDMEAASTLAALVGSESISLEQRVTWLHPDWGQDDIDLEVERLKAEHALPQLP